MLTNFSQKQTEKLIIVVKLFIYTMQDAEQRDHSPFFLIIKSHHYKWMYTPKHALTHTHTPKTFPFTLTTSNSCHLKCPFPCEPWSKITNKATADIVVVLIWGLKCCHKHNFVVAVLFVYYFFFEWKAGAYSRRNIYSVFL